MYILLCVKRFELSHVIDIALCIIINTTTTAAAATAAAAAAATTSTTTRKCDNSCIRVWTLIVFSLLASGSR